MCKDTVVQFFRFRRLAERPRCGDVANAGEPILAGIEHPAYPIAGFDIGQLIRNSLCGDLESVVIN